MNDLEKIVELDNQIAMVKDLLRLEYLGRKFNLDEWFRIAAMKTLNFQLNHARSLGINVEHIITDFNAGIR